MAPRGTGLNGKDPHPGESIRLRFHRVTEQLHPASGLKLRGILAAMALQAEGPYLRTQSLWALAGMLLVANQAALLECRPMEESLLRPRLSQIGVAAQAEVHRPAADLVRVGGRMRAVTGDAAGFTGQCRMGGLGLVQTLLHIGVARQAEFAPGSFHQGAASLPRRLVTGVALLFAEGRVNKIVEQLGLLGAVWVVALAATGPRDGLVEMGCLHGGVASVVAIQAKLRLWLGQVEETLRHTCRVVLMSRVTGGAAQIHGRMLNRLLDLRLDVSVATQAEILGWLSGLRPATQQMPGLATVGVVAGRALPGAYRRVKRKLGCCGALVVVTRVTELVALGGQKDLGFVLLLADLVTAVTSHFHRGMDHRTSGLIPMALRARAEIEICLRLLKLDWRMCGSFLCRARPDDSEQSEQAKTGCVSGSHSGAGLHG